MIDFIAIISFVLASTLARLSRAITAANNRIEGRGDTNGAQMG